MFKILALLPVSFALVAADSMKVFELVDGKTIEAITVIASTEKDVTTYRIRKPDGTTTIITSDLVSKIREAPLNRPAAPVVSPFDATKDQSEREAKAIVQADRDKMREEWRAWDTQQQQADEALAQQYRALAQQSNDLGEKFVAGGSKYDNHVIDIQRTSISKHMAEISESRAKIAKARQVAASVLAAALKKE